MRDIYILCEHLLHAFRKCSAWHSQNIFDSRGSFECCHLVQPDLILFYLHLCQSTTTPFRVACRNSQRDAEIAKDMLHGAGYHLP